MNNTTKEIFLPINIDKFNYSHLHSSSNRQTSFENNTVKGAVGIKFKPKELSKMPF
jgi:hypothetical protein